MDRRSMHVKPASVLLVIAGLAAGSTSALAQTRTWLNPVTGNWNVPGNWSGTNVPDTTAESALISALGGYTVFVNGNYSIGGLNITAPGAQVAINNGLSLDVVTVLNNGTITVSDATNGGGTNFRALGGVLLDGDGALVLNANPNLDTATMVWFNNSGTQSFTNGPLHTVQGTGRVYALLTNNGTVSADRDGKTLELLSTNKTNNSLMEAAGGGVLLVSGVAITQGASGEIAANGGRVDLSSAGVSGGQILVNSGSARAYGTTSLTNVTLGGTLSQLNGSNLDIGGGLTNFGEVVISDGASGGATNMRATGPVTLDGVGSVWLRANPNLDTATLSWFNNSGTQRFINGADHVIHGSGNVYAQLTNNGYVAADTPGAVLQLLSTNKINNGTLAADLGGVLTINGVSVDQTSGGAIAALNGVFHAVNAGVVGGTITSPAPSASTRISGTCGFTGVDFAGRLSVDSGSVLRVGGGVLTNDGTITINDGVSGGATSLQASEADSLGGAGEVVLRANGNLDTAQIAWTNNTGTQGFVNGAAHTIRGTGNVYSWITNDGAMVADQNGAYLQLLSQNKVNRGMMGAVGGGLLQLNGITVTQQGGGHIDIADGALRVVNSAIAGGPVGVSPSGSAAFSGSSVVSDVTLNGAAGVVNGAVLGVTGTGIVNNGVIRVSDGVNGGATSMTSHTHTTLSGTGSIVLDAIPSNLDTAQLIWLNNTGTQSFTNGSTHTIRGSGNVHLLVTNNGLMVADKPGRTLQLTSTTKTNTAVMRAENGATLAISGIPLNQTPTARVEAASANLRFTNAAVTGGNVAPDSGSGSVVAGSCTFNDVVMTGRTDIVNGAALFVGGSGVTNNGSLHVSNGVDGSGTAVRSNGNMTFSGSGEVELDALPSNLETAQLVWNNNTGTQWFNNGAAHTIRGSGNIHLTVNNFGTITADKPGRVLQFLSMSKVNEGVIRAENGGVLAINGVGVTQQNGGRLEARSGNISLTNASVAGGEISTNPGFVVGSSGTCGVGGATFSGAWNVSNGSVLQVTTAGLTNNGVIRVSDGSGAGGTAVRSEGPVTISGSGSLVLAANPANLDTAQLVWVNNTGTQFFINGAAHTLAGTGRVYSRFTNQGTISPGEGVGSAGVIDFRLNTALSATSVCRFEVSGTAPGQYDRLTGVGTMTLNGTLRASFFGGFTPTVNDNFTIISGPTIVGEFARVELPKGWWVEYGSNFARMHYTGCLADWNYSGGVDGDDVIAFFNQWDNNDPEADINLDGGVDGDDVIDFFARWDAGC